MTLPTYLELANSGHMKAVASMMKEHAFRMWNERCEIMPHDSDDEAMRFFCIGFALGAATLMVIMDDEVDDRPYEVPEPSLN